MPIPAFKLNKPNRKYTWADYQTWPDDERWEIIDGAAYRMSPSPTWEHQGAVGELAGLLHKFLQGKPCKPMVSPLDVKFDELSVVQPDLTVWCGGSKDNRGKLTVAVEVLSSTTSSYDLVRKRGLYEKHGVPEYWVVAPDEKRITRLSMLDGKYVDELFETGAFTSEVLEGFTFDVDAFFEQSEE